jgi:hypothetical protein
VYIHLVRMTSRFVVLVLVSALLVPWVPSFLCARPGAPAMPCCKTDGPCDLQMQANRCCAVEKGTAGPTGTAAVLTSAHLSAQARYPQLATVTEVVSADVVVAAHADGDRLWYPPAHDRSTSLFLRNAAILR